MDENPTNCARRLPLVVAAMQARYAGRAGVQGFKIHATNNVLGYFARRHRAARRTNDVAALESTFIIARLWRARPAYTTAELGEIEAQVANAGDRRRAGVEIFERLGALPSPAETICAPRAEFPLREIRCCHRAGKLAVEDNYVRPKSTDRLASRIEGGRASGG